MATDGKARSNKQSTITFTLPLSCQICLGKVKQPVLCSNHHVFCQLCMDIWLEKNKQCPTCRVDISEENPVRNIIGGHLDEEDKSRQSSAEIRRVRFEMLYREYEDEFEQMKKELIILRTENNILAAQLKDAEEENEGHRKAEDKESSNSTKDGPNLLLLTQNLQEAQKLYAGIKGDMANLKQENGKLKDENVNLTRENETLRLEIAQRSPKKFGRYTVVTLEAKVSELEKENRQLKNALQRSDAYIEDLENQISKVCNSRETMDKGERLSNDAARSSVASNKIQTKANHEMETDVVGGDNFKALEPSTSSVKRALFSKDNVLRPSNVEAFTDSDHTYSAVTEKGNHENGHLAFEGNMPQVNGHRPEVAVGSRKHPESIMKSSASGFVSKSDKCGDQALPNDRKSKKVKFDIQGEEHNVSSSFDLEMPSPYAQNVSDSPRTSQEAGKSIQGNKEKISNDNLKSDYERSGGNIKSASAFDEYITNLLEKSNSVFSSKRLPDNSLSTSHHVNNTAKEHHKDDLHYSISNMQSHDTGDSSHLSIPDMSSSDKIAGSSVSELTFANPEHRTKIETGDLNISMTPELSDCLQLMAQAERKLEQRPLDGHPYTEREKSALKLAQEDLSQLSLSKMSHPRSVSHSFHTSSKSKASTSFPSFIPTPDVSWKQKFYSSLSANPYKFNPSASSVSRSQSISSINVNTSDLPKPLSSHESLLSTELNSNSKEHQLPSEAVLSSVRPASREQLHGLDSKFLSSQTNSNLFRPAFCTSTSFSTSTLLTTNPTGDGASSMSSNSHNLHADFPKSTLFSDLSHFSFPSADVHCPVRQPLPPPSSSQLPPTSPPSLPFSSTLYNGPHNTSNGLTSTSSLHSHIEPVSSLSSYPSASLAFSNPLPPSLNNSALEWPEDSPGLSLPRPNGARLKSSDSFPMDDTGMLQFPSRDRASLAQRPGSSSLRNGKHNVNSSYISSSLLSDENSFQLPEPKKRLFNNSDDDLELPSSPLKTTKR